MNPFYMKVILDAQTNFIIHSFIHQIFSLCFLYIQGKDQLG